MKRADEGRSGPGALRLDRPLIFYALVSLIMLGPHLLPPTQLSQLPYDAQDAYIQLWDFWWTRQWLLTAPQNPYWTDLIYQPFGTSLAFAAYSLPYSLFSLPFQLVFAGTKGLVIAFNAVVFASFVLSGVGAYRLARHVTGDHAASLLAGLIFAFMPHHFLNMPRLYLLCIELLPFYVLALLKLWEAPSGRRAVAVAGWLALCFYSSLELALFLLLFSWMWLAYALLTERAAIRLPALRGLAVAGVSFLVLAAPLLVQQMSLERASDTVDVERGIEEVVHWSPALLSYITPSRVHPIYGEAMEFAGKYPDPDKWGMRSETFLGWSTLLLAALGLAAGSRGKRLLWGLGAGVFLVLSLGPQLRVSGTWLTELAMPYRILYELVPPLRGSRDPSRMLPVAMLMLSVLAALGAGNLLARIRAGRRRSLATAALAFAVLFEDLPPWPVMQAPAIDPVYAELADRPGSAPIIDLTADLRGLLAQTIHQRPIGYVADYALRGAPARDDFVVEQAFWRPRRVLGLGPQERAQQVVRLRDEIAGTGAELIVYPSSPISARQNQLARLLGADVSVRGRYVVADLGDTDRVATSRTAPAEVAGPLGLPTRPNVVLVTIDTLRADRTGAHGHDRATTPVMDALAAGGIRFANALSQAPWTLPALASIHTGLYPSEHAAIHHAAMVGPDLTTLAEALKAHGYSTHSVVANDFAGRAYGLGQGFDSVDESTIEISHDEATSRRVIEGAIDRLERLGDQPFFLWIHLFDPHFEYIRHPEFGFADPYLPRLAPGAPRDVVTIEFLGPRGRNPEHRQLIDSPFQDFVRAVYDEEIAHTDRWIGRFMEALEQSGKADSTVTVLTADHGEYFWERGRMYHGGDTHAQLVHVPLVISGPLAPRYRGHLVFREVETLSLARTIAEIAGLDEHGFGGENLLAIPAVAEAPRLGFSEGSFARHRKGRTRAVVYDGWKLVQRIRGNRFELYHSTIDPAEQDNLWQSTRPAVAAKRALLVEALERFVEERRPIAPATRSPLDPDQRERLKALGYIE